MHVKKSIKQIANMIHDIAEAFYIWVNQQPTSRLSD